MGGAFRRVILGRVEAIKVVQIPAKLSPTRAISEGVLSQQSRESIAVHRHVINIQTLHSKLFEYGPDRGVHGRRAREEPEGSRAEQETRKTRRVNRYLCGTLPRGLIRTFFQVL